jgi:hypothetical protein
MASMKYKLVKNFFSKEELKILDVYCQQKLDQDEGGLDGQTFSPSWYRDALTTAFLESKKPLIEKEMNIKLLTSYSYWRYYVHGATLFDHYDRPACEVSVTACMKKYDDWPIEVDGESFELEEGDGLIYGGYLHWHGRPGTYKGNGMAQTFLHYVDKNGPFTHHAFDGYNRKFGYKITKEDREIVHQKRAAKGKKWLNKKSKFEM